MAGTDFADSLVPRLAREWMAGQAPGASEIVLSETLIRLAVTEVFFASLKPEEGRFLHSGIAIVPSLDSLRQLATKWKVVTFEKSREFEAASLAKLAPCLGEDRYTIVSAESERLAIVGIGQPEREIWLFAQDHYPRIRIVGPADLVFLSGGNALFRYQAGTLQELRPDFFSDGGDPAVSLAEIATEVYRHRQKIDGREQASLKTGLIALVEAFADPGGHGGMLAILAANDSDSLLRQQDCDYALFPEDLGRALVNADESELAMGKIQQDLMGPLPEGIPTRALNPDELDTQVALYTARKEWQKTKEFVAGFGRVDGAVLFGADLRILGFGCKLPRQDGPLPQVMIQTHSGVLAPFDLTRRGTRHAAAANFACRPGRLAIVISADGAVGCFLWSREWETLIYWPIHVGVFSGGRW